MNFEHAGHAQFLRGLGMALLSTALLVRTVSAQVTGIVSEAPPPNANAPATEPEDVPGYAESVALAVHEYDRRHFAEALAHFQSAYRLYPNARVLRGLGKVAFELRNYGDSVRYFEQSLASSVKSLSPRMRAETEDLLARARLYVGEVHIAVEPASASISVDDVVVASGPLASLTLMIGDHVLKVEADGRRAERRAIHVHGGQAIKLELALAPSGWIARGPDVASTAVRPDSLSPLVPHWWLWTGLGLVAAGIATTVAVAMTTDHSSGPQYPVLTAHTPPGGVLQSLGSH